MAFTFRVRRPQMSGPSPVLDLKIAQSDKPTAGLVLTRYSRHRGDRMQFAGLRLASGGPVFNSSEKMTDRHNGLLFEAFTKEELDLLESTNTDMGGNGGAADTQLSPAFQQQQQHHQFGPTATFPSPSMLHIPQSNEFQQNQALPPRRGTTAVAFIDPQNTQQNCYPNHAPMRGGKTPARPLASRAVTSYDEVPVGGGRGAVGATTSFHQPHFSASRGQLDNAFRPNAPVGPPMPVIVPSNSNVLLPANTGMAPINTNTMPPTSTQESGFLARRAARLGRGGGVVAAAGARVRGVPNTGTSTATNNNQVHTSQGFVSTVVSGENAQGSWPANQQAPVVFASSSSSNQSSPFAYSSSPLAFAPLGIGAYSYATSTNGANNINNDNDDDAAPASASSAPTPSPSSTHTSWLSSAFAPPASSTTAMAPPHRDPLVTICDETLRTRVNESQWAALLQVAGRAAVQTYSNANLPFGAVPLRPHSAEGITGVTVSASAHSALEEARGVLLAQYKDVAIQRAAERNAERNAVQRFHSEFAMANHHQSAHSIVGVFAASTMQPQQAGTQHAGASSLLSMGQQQQMQGSQFSSTISPFPTAACTNNSGSGVFAPSNFRGTLSYNDNLNKGSQNIMSSSHCRGTASFSSGSGHLAFLGGNSNGNNSTFTNNNNSSSNPFAPVGSSGGSSTRESNVTGAPLYNQQQVQWQGHNQNRAFRGTAAYSSGLYTQAQASYQPGRPTANYPMTSVSGGSGCLQSPQTYHHYAHGTPQQLQQLQQQQQFMAFAAFIHRLAKAFDACDDGEVYGRERIEAEEKDAFSELCDVWHASWKHAEEDAYQRRVLYASEATRRAELADEEECARADLVRRSSVRIASILGRSSGYSTCMGGGAPSASAYYASRSRRLSDNIALAALQQSKTATAGPHNLNGGGGGRMLDANAIVNSYVPCLSYPNSALGSRCVSPRHSDGPSPAPQSAHSSITGEAPPHAAVDTTLAFASSRGGTTANNSGSSSAAYFTNASAPHPADACPSTLCPSSSPTVVSNNTLFDTAALGIGVVRLGVVNSAPMHSYASSSASASPQPSSYISGPLSSSQFPTVSVSVPAGNTDHHHHQQLVASAKESKGPSYASSKSVSLYGHVIIPNKHLNNDPIFVTMREGLLLEHLKAANALRVRFAYELDAMRNYEREVRGRLLLAEKEIGEWGVSAMSPSDLHMMATPIAPHRHHKPATGEDKKTLQSGRKEAESATTTLAVTSTSTPMAAAAPLLQHYESASPSEAAFLYRDTPRGREALLRAAAHTAQQGAIAATHESHGLLDRGTFDNIPRESILAYKAAGTQQHTNTQQTTRTRGAKTSHYEARLSYTADHTVQKSTNAATDSSDLFIVEGASRNGTMGSGPSRKTIEQEVVHVEEEEAASPDVRLSHGIASKALPLVRVSVMKKNVGDSAGQKRDSAVGVQSNGDGSLWSPGVLVPGGSGNGSAQETEYASPMAILPLSLSGDSPDPRGKYGLRYDSSSSSRIHVGERAGAERRATQGDGRSAAAIPSDAHRNGGDQIDPSSPFAATLPMRPAASSSSLLSGAAEATLFMGGGGGLLSAVASPLALSVSPCVDHSYHTGGAQVYIEDGCSEYYYYNNKVLADQQNINEMTAPEEEEKGTVPEQQQQHDQLHQHHEQVVALAEHPMQHNDEDDETDDFNTKSIYVHQQQHHAEHQEAAAPQQHALQHTHNHHYHHNDGYRVAVDDHHHHAEADYDHCQTVTEHGNCPDYASHCAPAPVGEESVTAVLAFEEYHQQALARECGENTSMIDTSTTSAWSGAKGTHALIGNELQTYQCWAISTKTVGEEEHENGDAKEKEEGEGDYALQQGLCTSGYEGLETTFANNDSTHINTYVHDSNSNDNSGGGLHLTVHCGEGEEGDSPAPRPLVTDMGPAYNNPYHQTDDCAAAFATAMDLEESEAKATELFKKTHEELHLIVNTDNSMLSTSCDNHLVDHERQVRQEGEQHDAAQSCEEPIKTDEAVAQLMAAVINKKGPTRRSEGDKNNKNNNNNSTDHTNHNDGGHSEDDPLLSLNVSPIRGDEDCSVNNTPAPQPLVLDNASRKRRMRREAQQHAMRSTTPTPIGVFAMPATKPPTFSEKDSSVSLQPRKDRTDLSGKRKAQIGAALHPHLASSSSTCGDTAEKEVFRFQVPNTPHRLPPPSPRVGGVAPAARMPQHSPGGGGGGRGAGHMVPAVSSKAKQQQTASRSASMASLPSLSPIPRAEEGLAPSVPPSYTYGAPPAVGLNHHVVQKQRPALGKLSTNVVNAHSSGGSATGKQNNTPSVVHTTAGEKGVVRRKKRVDVYENQRAL